MGMDVNGRNPDAESGRYFRASVWSWAPIHGLICELCSDLLSEGMLAAIGFNDGAGPTEQATCTEMANRFGAWMERNVSGHATDLEMRVEKGTGRLLSPDEVDGRETEPAFAVEDEHLKEWEDFLRHCGGFAVW
jgi:hypothetical protein